MKELNFLLTAKAQKIKFGLQRTKALLRACNNPEQQINSIQIVGTNGKGSTAAMIANALINNGHSVGLFTSPHLVNISERITINHAQISHMEMKKFIKKNKKLIKQTKATFFEVISVMAINYFCKKKVDIAILETGLGGKLDSITAMKARGLIFTSISHDHQKILGNTLEKISKEKAGAITNRTKFVIAINQKKVTTKVLNAEAQKYKLNIQYFPAQKKIIKTNKMKYLKGRHQTENGTLAYYGIKYIEKFFNLKTDKIETNIYNTFWAGRNQYLRRSPDIVFDVAHNEEGIKSFLAFFKNTKKTYNKKYLIVAFESNKNIFKALKKTILLFDLIVITETKIRNSMQAKTIKRNILSPSKTIIIQEINTAFNQTIQALKHNDVLVILGTHYFGPTINKYFKNFFDNQNKE